MTGGAKQQTSPLDPDYKPSIRVNKISCGDVPLISMMKSTEFGNCDHLGIVGGLVLDGTSRGRFLPEMVMRPVVVIRRSTLRGAWFLVPRVSLMLSFNPQSAIHNRIELGLLLSAGIHGKLLSQGQDLNGLMSVETASGQGQTEPFDAFGYHGRKCHS